MAIANANELMVQALWEIYDAEHQFLEGQQEMEQQATDRDLKSSIQQHISDTEHQISNLEQVFEQLGQQPQRQTNDVVQGLVSEAQQNMQVAENEAIRDCVIIFGYKGRAFRDRLLPRSGHGRSADGAEPDTEPSKRKYATGGADSTARGAERP